MVGYPHDVKGQGIYAYVTLMAGEAPSDELRGGVAGALREGDWRHCPARYYSVGAGPAKDSLGQNYAAYIGVKLPRMSWEIWVTPLRWRIHRWCRKLSRTGSIDKQE